MGVQGTPPRTAASSIPVAGVLACCAQGYHTGKTVIAKGSPWGTGLRAG